MQLTPFQVKDVRTYLSIYVLLRPLAKPGGTGEYSTENPGG
jgi:hypothetical protein